MTTPSIFVGAAADAVSANIILPVGAIGITNEGGIKVGPGAWNSLPYLGAAVGSAAPILVSDSTVLPLDTVGSGKKMARRDITSNITFTPSSPLTNDANFQFSTKGDGTHTCTFTGFTAVGDLPTSNANGQIVLWAAYVIDQIPYLSGKLGALLGPTVYAPNIPSIPTAGTVTSTSQVINFTAPTVDSSHSAATSYQPMYKIHSDTNWTNQGSPVSSPGSFTVTGLPASASVDYRVQCINTAGSSMSPTLTTSTLASSGTIFETDFGPGDGNISGYTPNINNTEGNTFIRLGGGGGDIFSDKTLFVSNNFIIYPITSRPSYTFDVTIKGLDPARTGGAAVWYQDADNYVLVFFVGNGAFGLSRRIAGSEVPVFFTGTPTTSAWQEDDHLQVSVVVDPTSEHGALSIAKNGVPISGGTADIGEQFASVVGVALHPSSGDWYCKHLKVSY